MAHSFFSLFISENRKVTRNSNNQSKSIQQICHFWKWHPAPYRARSYVMTRPVIKAAIGRNKIRKSKRGQPRMLYPRSWFSKILNSRFSKILNSRLIPEQAWKSGIFQVNFQYRKKSRAIQGIQGIPKPLAALANVPCQKNVTTLILAKLKHDTDS